MPARADVMVQRGKTLVQEQGWLMPVLGAELPNISTRNTRPQERLSFLCRHTPTLTCTHAHARWQRRGCTKNSTNEPNGFTSALGKS